MNTFIKIASVATVAVMTSLGTVHVESAESVSLGMVKPAHADAASLGYNILKCFHPSADFVRASLSDPYTDANGRNATNGQIDFRGGLSGNSYTMSFVIHRKVEDGDSMMRVTPTWDNAPFAPNPSCVYREWQRTN